jgi:DNA modification methylase
MIDLRQGDAYELIKEIPDKSIDLIVTDPPYLIENTQGGKCNDLGKSIQNMNNQLQQGEFTESIDEKILEDFVRICKNINIYIWCNHKQIPMYLDFFVTKHNCKFDIIIWNKTNATPLFNNKYLNDKEYCLYFRKNAYCNPQNYEEAKTVYCLPINRKDKDNFNHPTIKPLEIISNLVKNSSRENDTVLDCFMGSGTTGVACKQLKRNFIGFEIDEEYFRIAGQRIKGYEKVTDKNIELINLFSEGE